MLKQRFLLFYAPLRGETSENVSYNRETMSYPDAVYSIQYFPYFKKILALHSFMCYTNKKHIFYVINSGIFLLSEYYFSETLYCYFTDLVRRYRKWKKMSLDAAVDKAVMVCIKRGILKRFFIKMRTEMTGMPISIFEYDAEEELRKEYRHGRRDGERRGEHRGMRKGIRKGRKDGIAIGESRGKIIGLAQGISQSLINILSSYGKVPDELKAIISGQKDINVLNSWQKTALEVSDVGEFLQKTNL